MCLSTSFNEYEDLQEVAGALDRVRKALDTYEERWNERLFRNAAPSLRSEMDDTIEAIENRIREFQLISFKRAI